MRSMVEGQLAPSLAGRRPIHRRPLPLPGAKYHFATMDDPSTLFWTAAAALAAFAALAGWADHRRGMRRNLDKPGWVPWQLLMVLTMIACVVCVALGVLV